MPGFAKGVHNSLLDGPTARTADGDPHFVMATQAVQLTILLTRLRIKLNSANQL